VYTRNGDKEDARGRYRGWPAEFDEWIAVNAANKYRFSKLNSRVADPLEEPVDDASDPPFTPAANPPAHLCALAGSLVVRELFCTHACATWSVCTCALAAHTPLPPHTCAAVRACVGGEGNDVRVRRCGGGPRV
jgi:hypothetical protein